MAGSDAILIGNEWISEHYFTTDAATQSFGKKVRDLRASWDEAKTDDPSAAGTIRTRFTAQRGWVLDTLASLGAAAESEDPVLPDPAGVLPELYARLTDVLGYTGPAALGLKTETLGPITWVRAPGLAEGAPLVLVAARAVTAVEALLAKDADTLPTPHTLDDGTELHSVARTLSALFVAEDAPDYALVLAGRFLLVAERERWAEGRYLAVDLQLVCERNDDRKGGEVDRALACVGADSLAPDADGAIWWTAVREDAVKHTVGVSADLREGVRLSIEIIANEVVRRRVVAGRDPLPAAEAHPLAKQALRFLYRILFLLYAEASPQFGVLPVGSVEYERGYSLDRLRDLTLVELADPRSREGTHLYDSLHTLFRLVDRSTDEAAAAGEAPEGLQFRSLRADLFSPPAVAHIGDVKLGNAALQQVLRHLLLSKEARGKDRGFISYAELGINQLGAVYEGLMSYTGFFATEDLYEVAKSGDASKGSWVVPTHRADGIDAADFVTTKDPQTGETRPVLHRAGAFVFRLAGRERQQSASYYTPEVLTRFVVSQALDELLNDPDPETREPRRHTSAADILSLTICEPALGSGAFAIEAVRQLAAEYLTRRQDELGERIDPDAYPQELQRVKASIALHQVYGVDLNATAVELAEITLWLDTMVEGLDAPWFGLHLRRGNSLIGARRAVFTRDAVAKKTWYTDMPADLPLAALADAADDAPDPAADGRIHHFLLPAAGWGSAVEAKEAKDLAPEALARLKGWRKTIAVKPSAKQVDALVDLARRAETLWRHALRRLSAAEVEIRRAIPVWGAEPEAGTGAVQREQIEEALADPNGAYRRVRRVMDAWCALWFWPLTDSLTRDEATRERIAPPSLGAWLDALHKLMGHHRVGRKARAPGQLGLDSAGAWEALADAEAADLAFAGAAPVEDVLAAHPWLRVCERIAAQQGFFHWELDFAPVFARGGFDLQVGNPPWVRPRSDVDALLAEADPWWALALKPSESLRATKRADSLAVRGSQDFVVDGTAEVAATAAYLGSPQQYPNLAGLQPDLYRCFMERTWRHGSVGGAVTLIHPETHFTEEKAGVLRGSTYNRLRRHWQFVNELQLFDIHNLVTYGVQVYGAARKPQFLSAAALYHPDTVERSLIHDGSGPEPGLKGDDGKWDLRPHDGRITRVTNETLRTWHDALESPDVPLLHTRMVYAVNRSTASVLDKLAKVPRMGGLGLKISAGWDEKKYRTLGYFETAWGPPDSWDDVILQGPHLFAATPIYKTPNKTMLNNKDWSRTDFEALLPDAIPVTAYKPTGDRYRYDCAYTDWGDKDTPIPARDFYRLAWRRMAANTGERTLILAVIPPGAAHVNAVYSAGSPTVSPFGLMEAAGFGASLVADLVIRTVPKGDIYQRTFESLPMLSGHDLSLRLVFRVLRLNCVTTAYADLWSAAFDDSFRSDCWTRTDDLDIGPQLGAVGPVWDRHSPLRLAAQRRQALVEIDALVALMLGLTADELCTIYRTQFAVLYGYDRNSYVYDANGRLVPSEVLKAWRAKGDRITDAERTATHPAGTTYVYDPPFRTLDREADMRTAYAHFEQLLRDR